MHTVEDLHQLFIDKLNQEKFDHKPKELYEPFNYVLSLGGKRMRPLLTLMACDMFNGNMQQALDGAMAIELFHNFTLVHDDIMDEAPIRRGLPTVHIKYAQNAAILSGDVMLVYAYKFLTRLNDTILKNCVNLFNDTAVKVCEGQQIDLNFEKAEQVSMNDYLNMIELKTAVLPAFALQMGAIIANASAADIAQLYEFGINIGMAFQLQDDILDSFGDEKIFGKKTGGDISKNKKTILLTHALEVADNTIKEELKKWCSNVADDEKKISAIKKIFTDLSVKDFAVKKMEEYHNTAMNCLTKLSIPASRKETLQTFAEKLLYRNI
jgi:geranylgeranyl diphosphate synthase, type II